MVDRVDRKELAMTVSTSQTRGSRLRRAWLPTLLGLALACLCAGSLAFDVEAGRGVRPKGGSGASGSGESPGSGRPESPSSGRASEAGGNATSSYTQDARVQSGTILGGSGQGSLSRSWGDLTRRGPINITEDRIQYIRKKHVPGGKETSGNSVFYPDVDVKRLIRRAESQEAVLSELKPGYYERVVNAGRPIGLDQAGKPTSIYTVVTKGDNGLWTAYPGVQKHRGVPLKKPFPRRVEPPRRAPP